jgi:RND superfamily putative drug exporter
MNNAQSRPRPSVISRLVHMLAIPIIVFWLLAGVALAVLSPSLQVVAAEHSAPLSPTEAPSFQAMMHIGQVFKEFDSDSSAMVVLEGQDKLGDSAHDFYNHIVSKLRADSAHIENLQDFWSDPLTAAGSQSADGKAAYVQVFLAGAQGTTLCIQSVAAVRKIISETPAPPGVKAYVAGNALLNADLDVEGNKSFATMAAVSLGVILVMLFIVYRSIVTSMLVLVVVGIEIFAAQGVAATAGNLNLIGLTPYAVSLLTMLSIAAGTDYFIFLLGRYHEARSRDQDHEAAFYTAYDGVSHVILGSGLTIAGACLCLCACRLPFFQTMGVPCALTLSIMVAAALTLAPAVVVVGSRFGLFDPKRELSTRGWRKVGTVCVRWPKPIILITAVIAIVGFVGLLTYVPEYDIQKFTPPDMPANIGYAAAERHFTRARMNPELLMVEADHDLRDPAGMLVIDRIAKAVFHLGGIARVQTITRPLGAPIEHSSLPFLISMQSSGLLQTAKFTNDTMAQQLEMADELSKTTAALQRMYDILHDVTATTHNIVGKTHQVVDTTTELRNRIADFDDAFRPIRSYFYWEPHCFNIPVCWSLRSIFDALDGVDEISDQLQGLTGDLDRLDQLLPQMLATLPPTIKSMQATRDFMLSTHSTMAGIQNHMQELAQGSTTMGQYFDEAKNDDSFYLPPDVFQNPDFKRGLKMFVSHDGKAVRFVITHQGDPASVDGIKHVAGIKDAVTNAIKGTPLESATVSLAGPGSMYTDMQDGVVIDVLIACISAMILIFVIMLVITRSVIAALVIVGTVAASLGIACGLTVLIWQDLIGLGVDWGVLPTSVVILLAVGSDYNLLVVSRLREEIHAGLNTGIIRGMGATGPVVTAAGLVFAFTMMSMIVSDLTGIAQMGTTIGLGLLVDTLIVRSFMTPSIAAVLGRWFWWPLNTFRITRKDGPQPGPDTQTAPIPQLAMQ